jgi:ribosomal protein S6--L-glutamate ligase
MQIRVGVVGIPGVWSSERLADALEERTGYRFLLAAEDISIDLANGRHCVNGSNLMELDGLIIKKVGAAYSHDSLDRLDLLQYLEHCGLRIFSSPANITKAIDRLSCTLTLRKGGIPMPPTVITESETVAAETIRDFGAAILKPLFSTKARGMVVLSRDDDLESAIRSFKAANPIMYIQKKVTIGGRDLGVVFLGGDYLATYARVGDKDSWTTTTHFGGRYAPYDPSDEIIDLARQAQALFGLDFTSVDVAETDEGSVVFEVSAFGGLRGLQVAHDIDAAARFADYVIEKIRRGD